MRRRLLGRNKAGLEDGLIGYYKLNETVAGPVVNEVGTNATNYGAQINQPGAFGTSYNFNANSRVQLPVTLAGLSEFSVSFYFNLYSITSPITFLGGWNVNAYYLRLNNSGGGIQFESSVVTTQEGRRINFFDGTVLPTVDTWHHGVFSWKSGEASNFYMDKSKLSTGTLPVSGTIATGATELLGALLPGNTHSLPGRMDEVRFYNKKLDQATINAL